MSDKPILVFDSSEQDDFQMCARRWHLIWDFQLKSIMSKYTLDRGTLLHTLLAQYYKLRIKGIEIQNAVEQSVEIGRQQSLELEGLLPKECAEVYFQFREYVRYWHEGNRDQFYPLEDGIERPFFKIIYEDENLIVALQGMVDFLGKQVGTDHLVILDHKGMSKREDYTLLRNQFKNYCLALGVDTLYVNKVGFQKTLPPEERFSRQRIFYYPDQLEEQREVLIADAKMMMLYRDNGFFPPNFTSCDKYGGCQFKDDFCGARPDARPYKIGTHYLIGDRWDVGKVLEKRGE